MNVYSKFETELAVRPDDIDLYQHVHSTRYLDYVLAARFDQMERCYGVPMQKFLELGFGWVVRAGHLEFKRPLGMGEWFTVRTWVDDISSDTVKVHFEIRKRTNGKCTCDGWFNYTMINLATGRAEPIPDWIAAKYYV